MNIALEAGVATYVALAVALAVWVGIFVYLWRLDAQANDLRRRLDQQGDHEPAAAPSATLHSRSAAAAEDAPTGSTEPRPANAEQG
jgi:CcmD family protein